MLLACTSIHPHAPLPTHPPTNHTHTHPPTHPPTHARAHARARALLITLWSQFLDTDDSGSLSSLEFRTGIKQLVTRASAPPASLCSIRMPAVAHECRHTFAEIRQGCFFPGSAGRAVLPSTGTRTIHTKERAPTDAGDSGSAFSSGRSGCRSARLVLALCFACLTWYNAPW